MDFIKGERVVSRTPSPARCGIYSCMHTPTCAHTHVCTHTHIHALYNHTSMQARVHTCAHTHMHVYNHMLANMRAHVHTCAHMHTDVIAAWLQQKSYCFSP